MSYGRFFTGLTIMLLVVCSSLNADVKAGDNEDWVTLFDGQSLSGWTAKIRGHEAGNDPNQTFRVEDGLLTVSYANYDRFDEAFGHLFYNAPFSHYRLRLQYRFIDKPISGTPGWAIRNSGAMLHAQAPDSMPAEQDFPISIEFQFLGGLGDGKARPTGNMCSPGTHIVYEGLFNDTHCINSSSQTYEGDQWVSAQVLVLGSEKIVHTINGETVMEYGGLTTGGGVVSGHDPALKPEGKSLESGYIALQSEGHPIQFRNIEILNLRGCMNPHASNYRAWYVADDPTACAF